MGMTGPGSSPSTDPRQDDAEQLLVDRIDRLRTAAANYEMACEVGEPWQVTAARREFELRCSPTTILAVLDALRVALGVPADDLLGMDEVCVWERDRQIEASKRLLAVLSLVDDLRAALTYVGEFARAHHHQQPAHVLLHSLTIDIPELVERALAGSPAANKEPASAPWEGLEGWNVGVEFRGDDVVVMAKAPGQSVWRDLLAVTR